MAVVPATALTKVPQTLAKRESAVLGCAFLTAYGAVVNAGSVGPGDTVVVIGTGGVGLATVQVAKAVGARVIAVGRIKTSWQSPRGSARRSSTPARRIR